ncbi:hypothetical protein VTP01DRAFT_3862 [Rhizomucor pusillus]|uniref:uncharacterized protein n=1 Tax=Rhizomucor pusillus TaxID=4840 RepID=UPI0037429EFC
MFILTEVEDTVKIEPKSFSKTDNEAIQDVLNYKFANKVIPDVGLCICVHDILHATPGIILHLDGCSYVKAKFRLVVFKPFVGEVLTGRVKSCTPAGVKVTLGFFDDIHIPAGALQIGSEFDPAEQLWVWNYEGEKLFMDIDEPIRFRVLREVFTDKTPTASMAANAGRRQSAANLTAVNDLQANSAKIPPYSLTCTIQEDGLGLLSWWGS